MILNQPSKIRVLLVEDDEDDYILTQELLADIQDLVLDLSWISNFEDALKALLCGTYDVCLCDYQLGSHDGIEFLDALTQSNTTVPVIMLTGQEDREIDVAAMQAGAADYLVKSEITAQLLERSIRYTLNHTRTLAALREREEQYALVARAADDGIWDWNLTTQTTFFSGRWKSILGYGEDELTDQMDEWFSRIHPEDQSRFQLNFDNHLNGQEPALKCEYRIAHRDGTYRWVRSCGLVVRDAQNRVVRMAGTLTDLTYQVALYDALTGLPNRNLFFDQVKRSLKKAQRDPTYKLAVLYLDCDRFKFINDSLGHLIGDHLLIGIARRLEGLLRPGDVFARLGGDEFAILLENLRGLEEAERVARRINQALEAPFNLEGHTVFISSSIGIALNSAQTLRYEDLLRDADTAMYHAKSRGKSQFAIFENSMHVQAQACLQIETDLRYALDSNQLQLFYQPIINVQTGTLAGAEALIRWFHPQKGMKLPTQFIPVAEETQLIQQIDWWVLQSACQQMVLWKQQFHHLENFAISVNLSRQLFTSANLATRIDQLLADIRLPARYLKLEVTETTIIEDPNLFRSLLKQLQALGIKVEIDDFGSGYSSLGLLQDLPLSALKIDRSFLQSLEFSPKASAILSVIIQLAHHLGVEATAEGVENSLQLQSLKDLGCDFVQGYFFSKPLPVQEFESFFIRPTQIDSRILLPEVSA
jgi:diguanylate cyclase (GGDEF)-like protein/PAS domain S-box-containing protein